MHPTDTATPSKPRQFSFEGPCRVHDSVPWTALLPTLTRAALCATLIAAGCGRTSLDQAFATPGTEAAGAGEPPPDPPVDRPADRAVDRPVDRPADRPADWAIDRPADRGVAMADAAVDRHADRAPPSCVPEPEIC